MIENSLIKSVHVQRPYESKYCNVNVLIWAKYSRVGLQTTTKQEKVKWRTNGVGGFYICRGILILFSHCNPYSVNIFKNQFYMTVVENLSMDLDHHAQRKFNSFSDSRDCKVLVTSRLASEGDLSLIYRHWTIISRDNRAESG